MESIRKVMDHQTERAKKIFWDFLKKKQLKVTNERVRVLEEVFSTHEHFDAEDILMRFKQEKVKISRATIYRTLDLLVECGLVNKLSLGELQSRYEHILGHQHHDHLICKKCGIIIEFYDKDIEELQKRICQQHQFFEIEHSLKIFGLCNECSGNPENRLEN